MKKRVQREKPQWGGKDHWDRRTRGDDQPQESGDSKDAKAWKEENDREMRNRRDRTPVEHRPEDDLGGENHGGQCKNEENEEPACANEDGEV